jgi:hypothetical protein
VKVEEDSWRDDERTDEPDKLLQRGAISCFHLDCPDSVEKRNSLIIAYTSQKEGATSKTPLIYSPGTLKKMSD